MDASNVSKNTNWKENKNIKLKKKNKLTYMFYLGNPVQERGKNEKIPGRES